MRQDGLWCETMSHLKKKPSRTVETGVSIPKGKMAPHSRSRLTRVRTLYSEGGIGKYPEHPQRAHRQTES